VVATDPLQGADLADKEMETHHQICNLVPTHLHSAQLLAQDLGKCLLADMMTKHYKLVNPYLFSSHESH
jgi:hypothetical protein